jgi:hypothetical protein
MNLGHKRQNTELEKSINNQRSHASEFMLMKRYRGNPCTLLESAAGDDENKAKQTQFQVIASPEKIRKGEKSPSATASFVG